MGLVYLNGEEKEIYGAYNLLVYVKQDRYDWTISDKPSEIAYTSLRIERNGEEIYSRRLGNRFISEENFDKTIDNFLWWIDRDNPDAYDIENAVEKSLCVTDSLFNHRISNRKREEEREAAERERHEKAEAEKERWIMEIKMYCEKKNLLFKQYYDEVYLIKLHNENVRKLIENANNDSFEKLRDFMVEHPDNTDAMIVKNGKFEDIVREIA